MSNRDEIILRVQKELIGPGSDLFECSDKINFSDEVIADKPLLRYYSGILYPKQLAIVDNAIEDDDESDETPIDLVQEEIPIEENINEKNTTTTSKEDGKDEIQYSANTFFPSQYGISFVVSKECPEIKIALSFGNYKKAKVKDITLSYDGDSISLLEDYGLLQFVQYNSEKKILTLPKELDKASKIVRTKCLNALGENHRDSSLYKTLRKLFFKDKYKRYNNKIETIFPIEIIKSAKNYHYKVLLSKLKDVNSDFWWSSKKEVLKDNLWLHIKLYNQKNNTYVIKVFIENTLLFPRTKFSIAKESLNQVCLFQTEIRIETPFLQPFNDYKSNLYKPQEDRMLNFLYREKLSYGVGHNTACMWENCENDSQKPRWISSTFLPQYNVKSQSTEISSIDKKCLEVKELSEFNQNKEQIISNLNKLLTAYLGWINSENMEVEKFNGPDKELVNDNIKKCRKIYYRMQKGIELLNANSMAFRAFQLANTAIYIQMFQNQRHFSKQKDGFEAYERTEKPQFPYWNYATEEYPDTTKTPSWRPFQLAFILQCLPSFIDEDSPDRDLVDLLYFPTGGGKTEAYLALSAFLIFWRRMKYPQTYGGVNIIIRYTLRLLSAQQFERATKLVLACEFIRKNHADLGNDKITIGFWVGDTTIPNKISVANDKLKKTQDRLNANRYAINPFQISNCQWCNTKIIGRVQKDNSPQIGHRIHQNRLQSFCLNDDCCFSENNGGLPIVLIDEDIYQNPPTILFATVDKFAQLAWKAKATTLFNFNDNRKPELIIQDELHLLNGPLGSLVGLFENIVLSLCTTENQRPKIIASTATVKNVESQVKGLYNRSVQIFPQNATNADNSFFSKTLTDSKRRYVGVLPTGKTQTITNLKLNATLFFARISLWKEKSDIVDIDQFWTILSYFKSLKHIGRFANKITSELVPEIKQLQVRYLMNQFPYNLNYNKLPYYPHNLELTSRIANEKIKKNLDKLNISFDGDLGKYQSVDIVLATNMISVGLDVGRLNLMIINGMPPNTAEYIQASSRVARKTDGVVFTLFDPNNTRDLSYFEDYVLFHKTFYKQVEPISITPFAENALDKLLFTSMVAYFRHKMGYAANNMATALNIDGNKQKLIESLKLIFNNNSFADDEDKRLISSFIETLCQEWEYKIQNCSNLFFYGNRYGNQYIQNLLKPIQERINSDDKLIAMQSMRSVEPSVNIKINRY
ncbi:MAG TPA: helicase-related protein [Candidatus Egerieousia sp.]|nr:helicase-related protein [Candidatus Egerieousia sp.]